MRSRVFTRLFFVVLCDHVSCVLLHLHDKDSLLRVRTYLLTYLLTYFLLTPSAPADRQDPLPIFRCPGNAFMLRRVFPDHLIMNISDGRRIWLRRFVEA